MKSQSNFRLDSLLLLLVVTMAIALALLSSCSTAYEYRKGSGCYGANKTGERPGGIGKFKG